MGKTKTYEQFCIDVYSKLGEDYKILDTTYPGCHGKVKLLHYPCGNTFLKNVHDIISKGSGCPFCNGNRNALYNEEWVKNNTPLPYHYIKGYQGMKEKCQFFCDNCQSYFLQYPSRLINNHIYGCNCTSTKKKTHEQFLQELGDETLKEYDVLDKYINADTKIKFYHKTCGITFELSPDKFIHRYNKKYCPVCYYKKSHAEIIIVSYLNKNNINYHKEFTFPDFANRHFDFFIPDYQLLIEYDGFQHFAPIEFFGGEKAFQKIQQRDYEKNQYCLKHNLKLIRIPYTEQNNLNQILYEIFQEKSSTTIEKFLIKNEVEQQISD